ncbi:unnamed protein product [Rhizophagus irregularis]|nr:unnamed protein product [Rhizophagus irregularis]
MPAIPQWTDTLLSSNTNYQLYSRANRSCLIMDTTPALQVLDKHSQFQDIQQDSKAGYYYIKVNKEKTWVPILPGYTIFTKIKNSIFQLSINVSDEQKILFSWIEFDENDTSKTIAFDSQSDRFKSLITHIDPDGRISIPHLLGFSISGIVQVLISTVYQKYPQLYPEFQPTFKARQVTEKTIGVVQRKGKRLRREIENTLPETFTREGLVITAEEPKYVNYDDFMALLIEYKQIKQSLYNSNRQIKRLKQKIDAFKYEQDNIENKDEENEDQDEFLITRVNKIIEESKIGSTILVSMKQFISLVLQQSCSYCGETRLICKKTKVTTAGFSVKILVSCQLCETSDEFTNESLDVNFNACIATSGLVGGINRRSLQMVFACAGITSQLCKVSFHQRQACKQIIPVSFDCSWSHVRNAHQASGEMIYDGRDIDGYSYKPIIAFHVVEKSRKIKKNGEEMIIRKGNFDSSSRQMEHAILIALIEKLTPILEEQDILLNVTIDGDLDSNKTLGNVGIVNQIFADLKHVTKNIRKNCLLQHLYDNHDLCWSEVCWVKQNPEIQLKEPTLKTRTLFERNQFKLMLESIFKLPIGQGIGTTTRTSQNEAFNRVKLIYTSKLIDYSASYQTRHVLAILHNNEGICEMVNIARQASNTPLSYQDLLNITKIEKERDQQRINNVGRIEKRNAERALALQNIREDLDSFDWNQELVSYGKKTQQQIDSNSFCPSFATHIPDFNETTKCVACHAFPKCTARGLCRVCRFYVDNGLKDQIIDKNYQPKNEIPQNIDLETMCESALSGIFQFSEFRNGQKDAIKSFVQNYDTLVLKQTGGGKSLCYALPSVIATGITVVFSPLKALVDDQVLELIKVGIPCGGLYASTAQPIWYQRKVFQEIACGLTRVIITTPEKFKFNVGFRQMLEQIGISRGIRFVIDEAHCILDQEHFRDSWSFLCNLKKIFPTAPILLLTATCRMIDAQEIVTRLGIDHQRMFLFRDKYFGNNSIIYQVQKKKDNKEQFLEDILKITSEIEAGKCIIYCISIKECENLLTNLQAKVRKEEIAIYHGKLPAKEKSNALSLWKSIKIRIIVATNAFGMGVNEPDVRVVIHAGFPISMGKKFSNCAWPEDPLPQECNICDNCIRRATDNPVYIDAQSDALKMLEVINVITKMEQQQQITRNNVVDVFRQSQAKDVKSRFGHLAVYQEKFTRKLKTKEDAFLLLDDLVLRKIVEEDIILNRTSAGQNYTCSIFVLGLVEDALAKVSIENWKYLIKAK